MFKVKRKGNKMKRLFLVVVAVLSMSTTFAENENTKNVNEVNAYDMSVNIERLSKALRLTTDQKASVADVHRTFCGEMMIASQAHKDDRKTLVNNAVIKDLKYMRYILTEEQFDRYRMLLNTTFMNRGIEF